MTERVLLPTELDLRRITASETPLEGRFLPAQVTQGSGDLSLAGEVTFAGQLLKQGERFQLRGRIQAVLELACSRCLEPFPMPVDVEVDLTYVPHPVGTPAAPGSDEVELRDEDLSTAFYRDGVLDLAHMLREQFFLLMPMRPLCRPECRGLCPQCGTNLNVDRCVCTSEWQDPRLAALRTLIDKQEG